MNRTGLKSGNALASMTGYARASGAFDGTGFICEIKSVNARGLDIRMRLGSGLDSLEGELRRRLSKALTRGSINFSLTLDRAGGGASININEAALNVVLETLETLAHRIEGQAPRLDGILALKGVIEERIAPMDAETESALFTAILDCANAAIADLREVRHREGAELASVLKLRLDEIATLTGKAEAHPSRSRQAIEEGLRVQIAALSGIDGAIDPARLEQEALVLATKADIREELDRLTAHVLAAKDLLAKGGPIGRKLDFLAQEFNREANTLCSKSNAVELTAIGLDLKTVIDQLREQVQNLE